MPKLKREIFMRPVRFTHRFGERDDPFMPQSEQTFDFYPQVGIKARNGPSPKPFSIKDKGLHVYTEPFSPITKARGGNASLSGPKLDYPDQVADPIPQSTKERRSLGPVSEASSKTRKLGGK